MIEKCYTCLYKNNCAIPYSNDMNEELAHKCIKYTPNKLRVIRYFIVYDNLYIVKRFMTLESK